MKTLLVAINAKFIHTALSVRLLYLAARGEHDVAFREYTVKDGANRIADDILQTGADTVAFSCYIWNIATVGELCALLKHVRPHMTILLGGPEVTYDAAFFLNAIPGADYILQGEGEELFAKVLSALESGTVPRLDGVSGRDFLSPVIAEASLPFVESLPSPYTLPEDEAQKSHRVLYVETSRGCPYRCAYCLSSLERGVRFFSDGYLIQRLTEVKNSSARVVKFLDRSFCCHAAHALKVLSIIFSDTTPNRQYQIEINADSVPEEVLSYICEHAPKGLLRLEIGIQSTYAPTNRAVGRVQDFDKLRSAVRRLTECGRVELHLDLIAGLPGESFSRFAQSFDDVYALGAKELQLGFLKLLRGTSLRRDAAALGYSFAQTPPYEILRSDVLSPAELTQIHLAEDMLEKYHNKQKFPRSLPLIMREYPSPFRFFLALGEFYRAQGIPPVGYRQEELSVCLDRFTNGRFREAILTDYYAAFIKRPKRWCEPTLKGENKKAALRLLAKHCGLDETLLFRHGTVESFPENYLLVIYQNGTAELRVVPKRDIIPAPAETPPDT